MIVSRSPRTERRRLTFSSNRSVDSQAVPTTVYLSVQMVVDDGEQRREVGDRLVFGHVVVDAQTAAHVDETERKAQPFEVLDDDVDLLAHVLEDVQFADLRTDVQVNAHDAQVFQRTDPLGVVQNLFVGDAELAVGLTRIDAVVGLGIDVGIDAQGDLHRTSRLGGHRVEHEQLLDRLAVDRHDLLLDGVAQLLVALAHAGIDDALRVETRLDRLLHLVARRAVDAQPVFADDRKQTVVVIGLDRVVHLIVVPFRLVDHAFERLAQQLRVVKVEGGLHVPQAGSDTSA